MFAMATGEDEFPKCPLCQSAIPVGDGTFPFDLWIGARPKSQLKRNSTNPIAFRSYGIGSTTGIFTDHSDSRGWIPAEGHALWSLARERQFDWGFLRDLSRLCLN